MLCCHAVLRLQPPGPHPTQPSAARGWVCGCGLHGRGESHNERQRQQQRQWQQQEHPRLGRPQGVIRSRARSLTSTTRRHSSNLHGRLPAHGVRDANPGFADGICTPTHDTTPQPCCSRGLRKQAKQSCFARSSWVAPLSPPQPLPTGEVETTSRIAEQGCSGESFASAPSKSYPAIGLSREQRERASGVCVVCHVLHSQSTLACGSTTAGVL